MTGGKGPLRDQRPTEEALEQIAYMKRLVDETRYRVGVGYPMFLMWGAIWVAGYLGTLALPDAAEEWVWPLLMVAAFVGHLVDGRSGRYSVNRSTELTRKLFRVNLVLVAAAFALPSLLGMESRALARPGDEFSVNVVFGSFYIPFIVGVIYVINGVFLGVELVRIGAWLLASSLLGALIGIWISIDASFIWMAVAGGGSLILTGILLRKNWLDESGSPRTAS